MPLGPFSHLRADFQLPSASDLTASECKALTWAAPLTIPWASETNGPTKRPHGVDPAGTNTNDDESPCKRTRGEEPIVEDVETPEMKQAREEQEARDILKGSIFARYLHHVEFVVGVAKQTFMVHESLLALRWPRWRLYRHPYRIAGGIKDGESKYRRQQYSPGRDSAYLTPATFQIFVTWLYTGRLVPLPPSLHHFQEQPERAEFQDLHRLVDLRTGPEENADSRRPQFKDLQLVRLYQLGVFLRIPRFCKAAMNTLMAQNFDAGRTTTRGAICAHYDLIRGPSHFSQLLAEESTRMPIRTDVVRALEGYPDRFVRDLLGAREIRPTQRLLLQDHRSRQYWMGRVCRHHGHKAGEDTEDCKRITFNWSAVPLADTSTHLDYNSYVHVLIGRLRLPYAIHERLLCRSSPVFQAACDELPCRGGARVLSLDSEDMCCFALFTSWLYEDHLPAVPLSEREAMATYLRLQIRFIDPSGLLPVAPSVPSETWVAKYDTLPDLDVRQGTDRWPRKLKHLTVAARQGILRDMLELHIFAELRQIRELSNDTISQLILRRQDDWPYTAMIENIRLVYWKLGHDSRVCRFLMEEAGFCWTGKDPVDNADSRDLHAEFAKGVLAAVYRRGNPERFVKARYRLHPCDYHDHDGHEEEKRACGLRWTGWVWQQR